MLCFALSLTVQLTPQLERYDFGQLDDGRGDAVVAVGDWDGDQVEDYAVGASSADVSFLFTTAFDHGRVEVLSGATADIFEQLKVVRGTIIVVQ